ncbi:hypothetical protein LSTR_LSTR010532 [Laodelphax striatellus]|uniref:Uncharacterized protein n=1 Tax=Laodelphax striatellus TaxID=195883 RepID=A0A482X224_LAOST|nr:hypothetical protein LSTR_LSTR010532 [Laodelphax striatellus]
MFESNGSRSNKPFIWHNNRMPPTDRHTRVLALYGTEYTWEMDSLHERCHRDFHYSLVGKDIFGSAVSPNQLQTPFLRVGEFAGKKIGSKFHVSHCERLGHDHYLDEFKPKLHIYDESRPIGTDVNILSYFTFYERQVWNCTAKLRPKLAESVNFYRIVNVMHGIGPINTIFYFDGVEVMQANCPIENAKDIPNIQTVAFKEIKFLEPSTRELVRYTGKIDPLFDTIQGSIFKAVDVLKSSYDDDEYFEELPYLEKTMFYTQIIGDENMGPTLRIGSDNFVGTYGYKNQVAKCRLEEENNLLYTEEYLPNCLVLENGGKFSEMYGSPPRKLNLNFFSTMRQESWICSWGANQVFTRRVTEIVAAIPVAKVEYYSGVDVWKYKLEGESFSIRIRETYYHKTDNKDYQIRFNGKVKVLRPERKTIEKRKIEPYLYLTGNTTDQFNIPKENWGAFDVNMIDSL